MDKRQFLKTSGALVAGGMLSHAMSTPQQNKARTNWSGNYQYRAERLLEPKSVEEVQQIVKSGSRLKALGARHSFNNIADTTGDQVSLMSFKDMSIDSHAKTVKVGAGVKYGELAPYLQKNGFAIHNLASLPHISVVGACATATHGSGSKNGNLTTAVSAMEVVTPDGEVHVISKEEHGDHFKGAAVHLGALGVVTHITLDLQPTFDVRQVVYENLPFSALEHNLDEIFGSAYSVSLFSDWQNHRAAQVWLKSKVEPGSSPTFPPQFHGATLATKKLHPLAGHSAENCTDQMGIPGPWYERLPHFRMAFTPSSGDELQSEYFVPREKAYAAILAVEKLRDHITPHLMISEFRTIEADNLWLSPCYQRAAMTIHFTWKPEWAEVRKVLPMIEQALAPFDARPHWAKLFTMEPAHLQSLYPKLSTFREMVSQHDPAGKFRNDYLNHDLYKA